MAKSRVVIIKSSGVISSSGKIDKEVMSRMVYRGLCVFASESRAEDALGHLISPKDKVGLKVNCLAGPMASTHPEVALAVANQVKKMGIKAKDTIIWDRSSYELQEVGFSLNADGNDFLCFGTDAKGVGYSRDLVKHRTIGSLVSRLLERLTTVQINVPILKDHNLSGVTCSLKNWFGAIHNPNKYHENGCDPFIADLNSVPVIRRHHKLVVCDALRIQYNGGPAYHPQWAENFGGVILGDDPVAVDFVGYQIIDRIRSKHGLPGLDDVGRKPKHIFTAADKDHHLGKASSDEITVAEEVL